MSTSAGTDLPAVDDAVVVDVPARARSLRLLRMAVADAAADLDMDLDTVESARIAVDELATLVLATATWSRLRVRINGLEGCLRVDGVPRGADGEVAEVMADRVVAELLALCVDEYGVAEDSSFWFTIDKGTAGAVGSQ